MGTRILPRSSPKPARTVDMPCNLPAAAIMAREPESLCRDTLALNGRFKNIPPWGIKYVLWIIFEPVAMVIGGL